MSTYLSLSDDPIAAVATPFGEGAIGVIRTSGDGCIELCSALFSRPDQLRAAEGHTVLHGYLQDPASGQRYDEVLATVFRAPRSYTGQESLEFSCHGSPAGLQAIMGLLLQHGFRSAEPGEFTLRAFLNGKLDLTRAEAVQELVTAKTRTAHSLALARLSGGIFQRIDAVKQRLVQAMAAVSIQLDYPEDEIGEVPLPRSDIDFARQELRGLQSTYRSGRLYQEGVRIALAGRTNAGKSSLFNLLVREDRSIVSDQHGTTRDYIETMVSIEGIPVRLFDTAGLRDTDESVEFEGIRRSGMIIESAALVLYLIDAVEGLQPEDLSRLEQIRDSGVPCIQVWNKLDTADADLPDKLPSDAVAISARTGAGLDALHHAVLASVGQGEGISDGAVVIDSQRQHDLLLRALQGLDQVASDVDAGEPMDILALDLQEVLGALGEITGEVTSADVLDAMFSGFCVGK
ncbi:tRNA uridine-5-carboxymethylaminomethyl(34) synthesis GTPase MnmE [Spirochaeta africana]|uniref:tRNA modification GTPase MnmE n=1 Tax=Spirochaeta africana (strain ATCC 700263 / DSM 8902 / Z-7692) TaxID=889378 RepID=H9UMM0_SPIAZ|nr:tRNA uridine-5-carboxymethylaminomethyl(34) synthesis GTPase MnmE [Spirochaeta africana]AFG38763.1 tRNA modification GTPase TrmE [Spirochaeta africana DSM 8902]